MPINTNPINAIGRVDQAGFMLALVHLAFLADHTSRIVFSERRRLA